MTKKKTTFSPEKQTDNESTSKYLDKENLPTNREMSEFIDDICDCFHGYTRSRKKLKFEDFAYTAEGIAYSLLALVAINIKNEDEKIDFFNSVSFSVMDETELMQSSREGAVYKRPLKI